MLAPPPLPRNLEASLRDLGSTRPEVRASAASDLVRHAQRDGALRARAVPLLEERLGDATASVRAAACVGLGDLEARESIPRILERVDDEDAYVRQMALNALGEIGDERALPRLRRALCDARPEVRYQAIIAFSRVASSDETEQSLLDATHDDDEAIVHIALRLAEERVDRGERCDDRLVLRAQALLRAGSPNVALVSAVLLAKLDHEAARPLILEVVRDARVLGVAPDKEDERAAVEVSGELGLTEAIPALEKRAFGALRYVRDTCPFHAKIALARLGHARAVREILADLDSTSRDVVSAAVVAAGRARVFQAREPIQRLPSASADPDLVREALARLTEDGS